MLHQDDVRADLQSGSGLPGPGFDVPLPGTRLPDARSGLQSDADL